MKLRHVLFFASALLIAVPLPSGAKINRRPNIILIMADDLGWKELGSYGQEKIRTPHLDQMAKEGMRFTQFYTGAPVCAPARCNLMTGKHPKIVEKMEKIILQERDKPERPEFRFGTYRDE